MAQQIQIRHDTTANWALIDPVLVVGEMGVDTTLDIFKIGDGTTIWSLLPIANQGAQGIPGVDMSQSLILKLML